MEAAMDDNLQVLPEETESVPAVASDNPVAVNEEAIQPTLEAAVVLTTASPPNTFNNKLLLETAAVKNTDATIENARAEVEKMVERKELDEMSASSLQTLFREHEALKDKVAKLKVLLGRSAKAQRDAKVEIDVTHKKLDAAVKENQRLQGRIEKLASRPTHMELLADFETNFDRALLSVGKHQQQQSGGQDTSGTNMLLDSPLIERSTSILDPYAAKGGGGSDVVDNLLMQELSESKQRIEKLEKLNSSLVHRSAQLESNLNQAKTSMDELVSKISHLDLEKRMAVMEAEHATKAMQEKSASLEEMQMEIDLVTKSAQKAAARVAVGEDMMKSVQSDRMMMQHLEAKAKALEEWAVASNQAKTIAQERARLLETKLRQYQQRPSEDGVDSISNSLDSSPSAFNDISPERILQSNKASLVVGAGDVGSQVFVLDKELVKTINAFTERVVLRWAFDLTQEDADISFSILKGSCSTASERRNADALIQDRIVKGGAGGETENAFAIGCACTVVWSNSKSWIRPRTIRYNLVAVVISD
jgi:myosin heavy subunit